MAHFIYEYSANLPAEQLDLATLMQDMHRVAADSGVFPLAGIRSRAVRCEEFRVGDGHPDNGFINLSVKVGHGRDLDTRMAVGQKLFDTLMEHLRPLLDSRPLAVSFEMRELDPDVKFNWKNL